jgi:AAA family ATP:ADP antiporter
MKEDPTGTSSSMPHGGDLFHFFAAVTRPSSSFEKSLRIFSDIRSGEGATGLLLLANIFLVLAAYYLIKPVREGWLSVTAVSGLSKIEIKAYSSFGQSLVLLVAIPLYALLAGRLQRRTLITVTTLFSIGNLILFWLLTPEVCGRKIPYIGIGYYLWVGIFGVAVVAQFWAFAADLYSDERGRRLFPLIAIGASAGASVGAWLTEQLLNRKIVASFELLMVAIIPLLAALMLTWLVDRRETTVVRTVNAEESPPSSLRAPHKIGAYRAIFTSRYLLIIAILTLLNNWVNTNGENILYSVVQKTLEQKFLVAGSGDAASMARFIKEGTTKFYGNLFFWVNFSGLLLQAFAVSRLIKYGGLAAVLLLTPFISLFSYLTMALFPVLAVIRVMKIAENSSDYSVNNTGRNALWLPVPTEVLYKTKAAIDTLFARLGDGLAAFTVLFGTQIMPFSITAFLSFNFLLATGWLFSAVRVLRENRRQIRFTDDKTVKYNKG